MKHVLASFPFALPVSLALVASAAGAKPSLVEKVSDEVVAARDDAGNWGGASLGITHQRGPGYEAKKVLDLSNVPEDFWRDAREARLSACFCVRDYSMHDAPPANGLDEAIEVVVNGKARRVPTKAGLPAYVEGKPMESFMRWYDFEVPKEDLVRGRNEFVFRMAPPEGKKPDDYLYLGIDNAVPGGNSEVRFSADGKWQADKLNVPGARGEYMVRLYLVRGPREIAAAWRRADNKTDDPAGVLLYAGSHGPTTRVEWDAARIDRLGRVAVVVETADEKPFAFSWLDAQGAPAGPPVQAKGPRLETALDAPLDSVPAGIEMDKLVAVRSVTLRASKGYHPVPPKIDMCPRIAPPKGKAVENRLTEKSEPALPATPREITLANDNLRCRFEVRDGRLRLASLYNEIAAAEMVRRPDDCALFVVEAGDKRYAGSRDFKVRSMGRLPQGHGFTATLGHEETGLAAELTVRIDDALRMGLAVTNRGDKPLDFKVAFPHLAGLAVSDDPADDYYFYPYGGGIIADTPALIRSGYGDHEALYQVMDLFSPQRGAGLAVWCEDMGGRYKLLALRKHLPGRQETRFDVARPPTAPEYAGTNVLDPVPGTGMAVEYLRRTRGPGESFECKGAALWCHAGDWHAAMERYAQACRKAWKFRPLPSRLTSIENMIAVGWGKSPIFRDGAYRTDYLRPDTDCIELMSWWEWSTLGPGGFPLDQFKEKLGEAKADGWKSYLVEDPVTGKVMFNNNPGDYDGYNERWGGLPAFQKAVKTYRDMGALVTLYTDPFRVDRASRCGQKYGEQWGVVNADGTFRDDYDAWRMCHDVPEYRQWVAEAMARVLRETGADGVRLDEYGHRGSACLSKKHEHTFAETGCTEWQRGVAEATRLVREAMDQVNPRSVLTTEHPGYDYLMQFIEGCITYDLTVLASPLRPLECNIQRFYFPECKAFELDHRGADPKHRKRFFSAVGSFGSYYPAPMHKILREYGEVFASRDCRPLVPTEAQYVYANVFRAGDKTIWTVYNGAGHSYYGPALRVPLAEGEEVLDLLSGRAAEFRREGAEAVIMLFLGRGDVACLLRRPRAK